MVEMTVGADGTVAKSGVYRAVVINRAKLAYNASPPARWQRAGTRAWRRWPDLIHNCACKTRRRKR